MRYITTSILGAVMLFYISCEQQQIVSPEPITTKLPAYTNQGVGLKKAATRRTFEAISVNEKIIDPGVIRTTGNATHLRNQIVTGSVTGDFEGTFENVFNNDIIQQGNQEVIQTITARGKLNLTITKLFETPVDGAWVGHSHLLLQIYPDGSSFRARLEARGTGDLEGLILTGTATAIVPGTFQLQGHILDPKGRWF